MMNELYTKYLGLDLTSPVIAGSCNLTDNIGNLKAIEKAGAGAVVLKSIFEEEIYLEYAAEIKKGGLIADDPEFFDYLDTDIRKENMNKYLSLVSEAKKSLNIPVIASINCVTSREWGQFARKIETAGADALELNLFLLPSDLSRTSRDNEENYFEIIRMVTGEVKIPVAVKISYHFSNLGRMIKDLSAEKIKGLVLFNRFYNPDIDIEKEIVRSADVLSTPHDYLMTLRWLALSYNHVDCDLSATTGIHDWQTAVKMLLAGAQTVQLVSVLYKNGFSVISDINGQLLKWMDGKNYSSLSDFRGKLAVGSAVNPAVYERSQFMRTFGEYK